MSETQQLASEMQLQLSQHQMDLQKTLAAIESISRNNTVVKKSAQDVESSETGYVWEAVGRSFVKTSVAEYQAKIKTQLQENIDTMNSLNKKKHYLETSIKNTIDNLKHLIQPQQNN